MFIFDFTKGLNLLLKCHDESCLNRINVISSWQGLLVVNTNVDRLVALWKILPQALNDYDANLIHTVVESKRPYLFCELSKYFITIFMNDNTITNQINNVKRLVHVFRIVHLRRLVTFSSKVLLINFWYMIRYLLNAGDCDLIIK